MAMTTLSRIKEVIPETGRHFALDESVIAEFHTGARVISACSYGTSLWARTAKIVTELPGGSEKVYFLKCATEDQGRIMMEGEYNSMKEMHTTLPHFCPEPYAWGTFKAPYPPTYFFLCEFRNMGQQLPEPVRFCARLAELHRKSLSPTGKFGFHVATCPGKIPQVTSWDESWSSFYAKLLGDMLQIDKEVNGEWVELHEISRIILETVIPKLLEPLQSDGRSIKPCLVHGDLWDENCATDMETGEPLIFDAGAFYAHNEYEIGNWKAERHRLSSREYVRQYLRNFPISEPQEDWEDRNILYSMRYNIGHSIMFPGSNQRDQVYNDMCYLVEKLASQEINGT